MYYQRKHSIPNFYFNILIISNYTFVFYTLGMFDGEKYMQYNLSVIIIYSFLPLWQGSNISSVMPVSQNEYFFLRATFKLKFEWFRLFLIKRTFEDRNINTSERTDVMQIWNNLTFLLSIYCQNKNIMIYCIILSILGSFLLDTKKAIYRRKVISIKIFWMEVFQWVFFFF